METHALTIRLSDTPSGLTSAHLHHQPHFLQAGCPSCCPTNSVKAMKASLYKCFSFLQKSVECAAPESSCKVRRLQVPFLARDSPQTPAGKLTTVQHSPDLVIGWKEIPLTTVSRSLFFQKIPPKAKASGINDTMWK